MERKLYVIVSFVSLIVILHMDVGCAVTCSSKEYKLEGRCCPLCDPGSHVHRHCTEFTSTSCLPCSEGTFMDQPNGRINCSKCNNCSAGPPGLREKSPCTATSNAVCEPSDGFYCVLYSSNGCFDTKKHSSCRPGQYVKQNGTSSTDTVCADCTGDTYSDGSFTSCQPHTHCESKGLHLIKPGDHASDSTCGERSQTITDVVGPAVVVGLVVAAVVAFSGGVKDVGAAVFGERLGVAVVIFAVILGVVGGGGGGALVNVVVHGFGVHVHIDGFLYVVAFGVGLGIIGRVFLHEWFDEDYIIRISIGGIANIYIICVAVAAGVAVGVSIVVVVQDVIGGLGSVAVGFVAGWLLFFGVIVIGPFVARVARVVGVVDYNHRNTVNISYFFSCGIMIGIAGGFVGGHDVSVGLVVGEIVGVGFDVGLVIRLLIKRTFLHEWCRQRISARRKIPQEVTKGQPDTQMEMEP